LRSFFERVQRIPISLHVLRSATHTAEQRKVSNGLCTRHRHLGRREEIKPHEDARVSGYRGAKRISASVPSTLVRHVPTVAAAIRSAHGDAHEWAMVTSHGLDSCPRLDDAARDSNGRQRHNQEQCAYRLGQVNPAPDVLGCTAFAHGARSGGTGHAPWPHLGAEVGLSRSPHDQ
jgi:hypothetical protein